MNSRLINYCRSSVAVAVVLVTLLALVAFGMGILFAASLDRFHVGGFPLGFWFANLGFPVAAVILLFLYCLFMAWLDDKYNVHG